MRKAHFLTKNHGSRVPNNLIFVDTETDSSKEDQRLILGCATHVQFVSADRKSVV